MKTYFLYSLLLPVIFLSCSTISERRELGAALTEAQIESDIASKLEAFNTDAGGNQVVLKNNSNYGGKWNTAMGSTNKIVDTIIFLPGSQTISFDATTDGGIVTVTKTIKVDKISHDLPAPFSYLLGTKGEGTAWVYALDHPLHNYWGMVNAINWKEFWWKPDVADDFSTEFSFTYNNGLVFTQNGQKGSFALNPGTMEISFSGVPLHLSTDWWNPNKSQTYQIVLINENELVLLLNVSDKSGDWDWFWRLKRKGYTY